MKNPSSPKENIDHKSRGHHRYGMSKLGYLAGCPLFENVQGGDTTASEEGTANHEVVDKVADVMRNAIVNDLPRKTASEILDGLSTKPEYQTYDQSDWHLIELACQEIDKWVAKGDVVAIHNEIRVELPDILRAGRNLNYGTLDLLIEYKTGAAVLIDWKFGWLPVAHAAKNDQILGYTVASFAKFSHIHTIIAEIYQPKISGITNATFYRKDLPGYLVRCEEIVSTAEKAQTIEAICPDERAEGETEWIHSLYNVGDHCTYCGKKGSCPAKAAKTVDLARRVPGVILPDKIDTSVLRTPQDYVALLYAIDQVQDSFDDIRSQVKEVVEACGGEVSIELGDRTVSYRLFDKKGSPSVGSPKEFAEVLEPLGITPEQIMEVSKVSLKAVMEMAKPIKQMVTNNRYEKALEAYRAELDAKIEAGELKKTPANKLFRERKKEYREHMVSLKEAEAQIREALVATGVVVESNEMQKTLKKKVTQHVTQSHHPQIER